MSLKPNARGSSLLALLSIACAEMSAGPIGTYYLTTTADGNVFYLYTIQGNSLTRRIAHAKDSAIAVAIDVRTVGTQLGFKGALYDRAGNYLGTEYTNNVPGTEAWDFWDGTTDGVYNYSVGATPIHNPAGQWLYRFDRTWNTWEVRFDVRLGGSDVSAITYDPDAQELLVAKSMAYGDDPYWRQIHRFDRSGNFLGDIVLQDPSDGPNLSHMAALAIDVDRTLWFVNNGSDNGLRGYLYHYALNGAYLGRQYYPELAEIFNIQQQFARGGEISGVPEPSTWLLMAGALLALARRRR